MDRGDQLCGVFRLVIQAEADLCSGAGLRDDIVHDAPDGISAVFADSVYGSDGENRCGGDICDGVVSVVVEGFHAEAPLVPVDFFYRDVCQYFQYFLRDESIRSFLYGRLVVICFSDGSIESFG